MSYQNTGGPAFPRPASIGNNYLTGESGVVVDPQRGMSLRDYLAAKAMQGILANPVPMNRKDVVPLSFFYADEMLKAREQ